jgi:hypothetical protein
VRGARFGFGIAVASLVALACNLITGAASLVESGCVADCGSPADGSADGRRDARRPDAEPADAPHDRAAVDARDVAVDARDAAVDAPLPPITFLQTNGAQVADASSNAVPFVDAVQEGDTLIVPFDFGTATEATVLSVKDTLDNNYVNALGPYAGQGSTQYVYYAVSGASGSDTVTVAFSESIHSEVYIHEYSGLDPTNTFDVGAFASNSGTSSAVDGMTAGPITTSASNELLFAIGTCFGSGTPGPGFTQRSKLDGNITEDMIAKTPGDYTAVATATPGGWVMSVVAFHGL